MKLILGLQVNKSQCNPPLDIPLAILGGVWIKVGNENRESGMGMV